MSDLPLEIAKLPPEMRGPFVEVLRRIEAYEARVTRSSTSEPWSHEYKGDSYWLACRRRIVELVDEKACVRFTDIRFDPWFIVDAPKIDPEGKGLNDPKKWLRAVNQHFVPGSPRKTGDLDLIPFPIRGRGKETLFLCRSDELHCAVDEACRVLNVNRRRAGGIIARTRRSWKDRAATTEDECHRCGSIGRKEATADVSR
jgi:hypothetical protein